MPRTSHAFLLRLLFVKMIFAILLTYPFETHAQGHGGRDRGIDFDFEYGNDYGHDYGGEYNGGIDVSFGRSEIIRQSIHRSMRYFDILDVERELNLRRRAQIVKLTVRARSQEFRSAFLQLQENGRSSGISQSVSRFSSTVDFFPTSRNSRLEIQAQGDLVIEEIIAEVIFEQSPIPGPGPRPGQGISIHVNERIFGSRNLPLLQLARQQGARVEGLRLQSVTVQGESLGRFSHAEVRLIVNGSAQGFYQRLNLRGGTVSLSLNGFNHEIGRDIRTLQLEVRGDAQINTVILESSRRPGPGPGPQPAPMLRLSPQKELNGRLSQTLEQAINAPIGYSNRLVSRIVIAASTRSSGEFSIVDISRGPVQRVNLNRSVRTTTIHFPHAIALRDIGFNMIGNARIENIDIEFLR